MLDQLELDKLPADEQAKTAEQLRALLRALDRQRADANDAELVWIKNRRGIREMVPRGHWRNYLQKQTDEGYELLTPAEVEEEGEKVRQSAAIREEKAMLWSLLAPHEQDRLRSPSDCDINTLRRLTHGRDQFSSMGVDAMQKRIEELEEEVGRNKRTRRPE